MDQEVILVPMACAVGFGLPIGELQAIPTACIYNPGEDVATVATWLSGAIPVPWVPMVISAPLAYRALNRLHKSHELKGRKPPNSKSP